MYYHVNTTYPSCGVHVVWLKHGAAGYMWKSTTHLDHIHLDACCHQHCETS